MLLADPHPLRLADLTRHPHYGGFPVDHPAMKTFLGVPIATGSGPVLGRVYLTEKKGGEPFTAEDEAIAMHFAHSLAVAIENARLYEQTRSHADSLLALQHQTARLRGYKTLSDIYSQVLDSACAVVPADIAVLPLVSEDGSALQYVAARGPSADSLLNRTVPISVPSLCSEAVKRGESIYVADLLNEPQLDQQLAAELGMRCGLCVPLIKAERVIGAITLLRKEKGFSPLEAQVLSVLGNHAAEAIENARLFDQVRGHAKQLQIAYGELQSAQEQIIQQERLRAVGQMASGVAHDLNNTLTPILGYTDLLLRDPQLPEGLRERVRWIHTAGQDAAAVVQRLQLFYRPPTPAELTQSVNLVQLVRQIPELTRPKWRDEAQHTGRTIEVELDLCDTAPVRGIAHELREVLTNMVLNAVDAMPSGGQITLRVRATDETVCAEVTDTGTGMTEEVRLHCFEPFFTTKGNTGTGLGLSVCHGIIQRHGGTIESIRLRGRARPSASTCRWEVRPKLSRRWLCPGRCRSGGFSISTTIRGSGRSSPACSSDSASTWTWQSRERLA
jgi:signal transduction histidine kinase